MSDDAAARNLSFQLARLKYLLDNTEQSQKYDRDRELLKQTPPAQCPQCSLGGRIKAEMMIRDGAPVMTWYCYGCGFEWPRA
jgi:hypothetical protein